MYIGITNMRKFFYGTLSCFFLLFPLYAWGQNSAYIIPGYAVTHFTDENGLPQNSIKAICIDDDGYIWFGTEAGPVQYDGRRFRLFSKEEMGTSHSRIALMNRQVHTGQLFAITENGEQVNLRIHKNRPIFLPLNPYFSNAWATAKRGEQVISNLSLREEDFPPFDYQGEALIYLNRDTFFLTTPRRVVCRTFRQVLWEADVLKKTDQYYYWQKNKLYLYNHGGTFAEVTPQGVTPALHIPRYRKLVWNLAQNQTFVHTWDNKLLLLEVDSAGKLVTLPFMEGLSPDFEIEDAFHIKKEIIFIGSMQEGLLVYKKQHFRTLGGNLPGRLSIYYAIDAHGNDIITDKTTRLSPDGKTQALLEPNPDAHDLSIAHWGNDTLLFTRFKQLHVYVLSQKRVVHVLDMHDKIICLYVDPKGRTWMATRDRNVYLIDPNFTPHKKFSWSSGLGANVLFLASAEWLLAGTATGLLSYHIPTGHLTKYTSTESLNIRHIFRSKAGYLYFCTYGDGIFVLNNRQPVALPVDRSNYLKMTHCIIQDHKNRLWISSNKGLFMVPETDVLHYIHGESPYIHYHYLDKTNGFLSNEFNGGGQPAGTQLQSGHIAFPSMNGVVTFHPDSLVTLQPKQDISIEKIAIDETFLDHIGDTLTVNRKFKRLEIYLSTPYYGSPENLMFDYTFDSTRADSWVPIRTGNSSIAFTSLPPGYSYISFRQKRRVGLGAFSRLTLILYKPKAVWELSYFWVLCAGVLSLAILLAMRLRTRTLKQRNRKLAETVDKAQKELLTTIHKLEKKTRFQQWLTSSIIHDLRGPLRFINFYGGDIKKDDNETNPAQNKFLKSVYFSALKIYNYSDNLVQLLSLEQNSDFPPEQTDFSELMLDKLEQFREQATWNNIQLELDPDSDPFIYVNKAALSIIIQNLLDNAVKNFKDGRLSISLKNTEHESIIEICDEGPGLPVDLLQKFNDPHYDEISRATGSGLGLWLVKSLMAQTDGLIRFQNLPQKGLAITLTWKIIPPV